MKKLLAILLTLSLLLSALSALAELGSADVSMNGNQYHISLESVEIKDGRLYVALNGMAQTMAFGSEGIQLAADIVPVYGEERLYASDKDILFGADVTFRFDRDTLPDSILMIPTQDAENPITLWQSSDEEPAMPTATLTPEPTPEPTLEPTSESTEDLPDVKSLLDAGAQDAVNKLRMGSIGLNERVGVGINAAENATPTENSISDIEMTDVILDALKEEVFRTTYDALLAGEVIQKGSKGDTAKGVQQMLVDFGQSISVDGSVGSKTIAALNAVQSAFGLKQTDSLDAEGYAALLPRLLIATDLDAADELLLGRMDAGEYDYMRACAMLAQEKYASAKALFEESGWGDWEERVEACVQPWPKTGVLYKNPSVKGSSTELTVKFNTDPDTAMLVKIYTTDGVLARTMFIGGTGKATTSLPAGTYIIKDGTGHNWYGEEEAFGKKEGSYEIMTFDNGEQLVELKRNYRSTITVNVQENDPNAAGVGSDYENWEDF